MHRLFSRPVWAFASLLLLLCPVAGSAAAPASPAAPVYRNFRSAIFVVVYSTRELADRAVFERQYSRVFKQLKFDKVYLEVYRDHQFATDAEIEATKAHFRARGIAVAGGVTLAAGGQGGQFGTFDYENPADRAECRKAAELAARHFDEVILDDFFFYNTKSAADIAAKGARSWSAYRLDVMRRAAADLVVGPARKVNPRVRMVIKYPNWYEHFQESGYDLEKEPRIFGALYTGTETREADLTDQFLQPYQSYEIFRFFSHVLPGGNGGGWVDTHSLRNVDRYVGQLWDTLFAGAPEITLFNWFDMIGPRPGRHVYPGRVEPSDSALWVNRDHWKRFSAGYRRAGADDPGPGWARAAAFALTDIDRVLGHLGHPVGIAAYKPYQSDGEDYLQNYLGCIGLPIEMTPDFPETAQLVLLTESASFDPDIVGKIRQRLLAGGTVVVTSGFLGKMQDKGFRDIVSWQTTGRVVQATDYIDGFGAGAGVSLNDPGSAAAPVLIPEVQFYTNDSWAILRASRGAKGYPMLLGNRYGKGTIYLMTVPDNPADLYRLPPRFLAQLRAYLMPAAAVRLESAPPHIGLYTYDNGAFVLRSWRDDAATVEVSLAGSSVSVREIPSGTALAARALTTDERNRQEWALRALGLPERTVFRIRVPPHGYRVLGAEVKAAR